MDLNGDLSISYDEAEAFQDIDSTRGRSAEDLLKSFAAMDTDGNGIISTVEFDADLTDEAVLKL